MSATRDHVDHNVEQQTHCARLSRQPAAAIRRLKRKGRGRDRALLKQLRSAGFL